MLSIIKKITISDLQMLIKKIDHKNNSIDKYFYKLTEEVGELAQAIRKDKRLKDSGTIKGTIEEELYDVLYYVICLANMYDINLEECMFLKEKLNAEKYNRKSIFDDEKIKIASNCEIENECLFNYIEVTYKTIPEDNMKEYISVTTSHKKKYLDIDSWYLNENIVNKLLCLKEIDGKIITALKRKNSKEMTTLLCGNYQGFKENRVIKEHKNSVTLWNGIGVNIGYVIGSYNNFTIEYGKKINGEEYYYASKNNHPTLCDITPDFVKVPLNFLEFNAAIEGITLEKSVPISSKIREEEEEHKFGVLKKIES